MPPNVPAAASLAVSERRAVLGRKRWLSIWRPHRMTLPTGERTSLSCRSRPESPGSVTLRVHHDPPVIEQRGENSLLGLGLRRVISRVSHEGKAAPARIDMPLNFRLEHEVEANVLLQRIYWRMHIATLRRDREGGLGR